MAQERRGYRSYLTSAMGGRMSYLPRPAERESFWRAVDQFVIGAVKTNVYARNVYQTQSGLLNKQKMSIGSVD